MPARKKTRADRVAETFDELYRVGKARARLTEEEITVMLGFKTRGALLRRREQPLYFTLGEILILGAAFRWTPEEWSALNRHLQGGKAS